MERSAERCEDLWRQKVGALVEWFMRPTISPLTTPSLDQSLLTGSGRDEKSTL